MTAFGAALWVELLKARRSRVPWLTAAAFSLAPLAGGLFMFILQDPARARALRVIRAKAQIVAGTADWPSYLDLLAQSVAVGGLLVFGVATAWVFGREFADRTVKDILAVPTSRGTIVGAKLAVVVLWCLTLTAIVLLVGLAVGRALGLPGWSAAVALHGGASVVVAAMLTTALMPAVAFAASAGRGYLAALGWVLLSVVLAQIVAATGWGDWFPWSVPALRAGLGGPLASALGVHSYAAVAVVTAGAAAATVTWWRRADQTS